MSWERWLYKLRLRVRSLLRRPKVEEELAEELRFHIEHAIERERAKGLLPVAARHAALRRIGGIDQHMEASRDARRVYGIESALRDLRHGLRTLRRDPVFTLVVVLTLALGMGANTALFSLIDAVLLRTLPVQRPAELYFLNAAGTAGPNGAPPYPYFQRVRAETRSFAGLAAMSGSAANLVIAGRAEQVQAHFVSGSYFDVLGVQPFLGRLLVESDERLAPAVAVISYGYWQRRFDGDASIIGKVVRLDERTITIAGVSPPEFFGLQPGRKFDVVLPITLQGEELLASKDTWWLEVVARLAPGVGVEQAQANANRIYQNFMADADLSSEMARARFDHMELISAEKGLAGLRQRFSRPLLVLLVVVALVLAIACTNVANLLLARAAARRREIAVRLALGAGPARVARQLITETLLLFVLGALAGLGFAYWAGRFLVGFFAVGRTPIILDLAFDARVLAFTAVLTLLTMVIFGLAPAVRAARADPQDALKGAGGRTASRRVQAGHVLVVTQVAFSLVLLMAAGLFLRTMNNLTRVEPGFESRGLLTLSLQPLARDANTSSGQFWSELLSGVRALPGVQTASLSVLMPLSGRDRGVGVSVPGFQPRARADETVHQNHISDGYFKTLRTEMIAGRDFHEQDRAGAPGVAILNETAARFYFGDRTPLGSQIQLSRGPETGRTLTVVGIVGDATHNNLRQPAPRFLYLPILQPREPLGRLSLIVQTKGAAMAVLPGVRRRLEAEHPNVVISDVLTMQNQIDAALLQERLVSTLCTFFGFLGLLLAALGLYGVMSNSVAGRTREIGIRSALGAGPRRVTWTIIAQSMGMIFLGISLGWPTALLVARPVARLLYGLDPADLSTAATSAALLVVAGLVAAWIPARRAAGVDPLDALRRE